ncbi:MAG: DUF1800 family protein [Verrucomicrobiota bacterium]
MNQLTLLSNPLRAAILLLAGCLTPNSPAQSSGVLREVWTNLGTTRVSELTNSSNFPDSPILQVIDQDFASPVNYADRYGIRMRALLKPTVSGEYTFWVSGDDNCELWLGTNQNTTTATQIARVPGWTNPQDWHKYPEQQSASINLIAGASYYIEALMKENGGGDSLSVAWSLTADHSPQLITGNFLTPPFIPEPTQSQSLVVKAGADHSQYFPNTSFTLAAQVLNILSNQTPIVLWKQVSGPQATLQSPSDFSCPVTLTTPGNYVFKATAESNGEIGSDTITLTLEDPLHPKAGSALNEIWYGISGNIENLTSNRSYPDFPHAYQLITNLSTPRRTNDLFGSRTTGLLLIPEGGDYQFFLSADDYARFFLDTGNGLELLNELTSSSPQFDYSKQDTQTSPILNLAPGAYPFELLHKEQYGHDFVSLVWKRPGREFLEDITHEFLALPPHASKVIASTQKLDPSADFTVFAGHDQTLYLPELTTQLDAYERRRRWGEDVISRSWSLIDGPSSNVTFSTPNNDQTSVTLNTEGTYTLAYSVETANNTSSDSLTITVAPEISGETGFLKRDVWLGDFHSFEDLRQHPDFPNNPDITTRIPNLIQESSWSDKYATRITGTFVAPPSRNNSPTVDYTFYLFGDDAALFSISTDENESNLRTICSLTTASGLHRYNKQETQISPTLSLEPGKRYFIELLHRERWSSDYYGVSYTTSENPRLTTLSGSLVEDNSLAPMHDTRRKVFAHAGADRTYYWPHNTVTLAGEALKIKGASNMIVTFWNQIQGPDCEIDQMMSAEPNITFEFPGTYVFKFTVWSSGLLHSDTVTITIEDPQDDVNGYLTRSLWFDRSGRSFSEILSSDPGLNNPHFTDLYPGVETPRNFTNFYGTRLEGFLTVPIAGDYTFSIVSRDYSYLAINLLDGNGYQDIASHTMNRNFRDWNRATNSTPFYLEEGVPYPIRILHKDYSSNEHLSVALEGPATNGREVISRGFLSPASDAPIHNPHITLSLGPDKKLLLPHNSLSLAALVYDIVNGPEALTYQWSSTSTEVSFSNPQSPVTEASFPSSGVFEISLTASDGLHQASDSLLVTVSDPLTANTGQLLREVWTGIAGNRISHLTSSPKFQNTPDLSNALKSFDSPANWSDNYGQRLSGYLSVPASGDYELLIASDDESQLWLNPNGDDFTKLELIAALDRHSGRYRYDRWPEKQISRPLALQAGKRYAIEVLHKEGGGNDYLSVAYRPAGSDIQPITIPGALLSLPDDAEITDPDAEIIVRCGNDLHSVWPTNEFHLTARAYDQSPGPYTLTAAWSLLGNPAPNTVLIHDRNSFNTGLTITAAGTYDIQLTVTDGNNVASDTIRVTIDSPVAEGTGSILCELFENINGHSVTSLKNDARFPEQPTRTLRLTSTQFADLGDRYGALLRGYLHPPTTGTYQFNITSDDWSEAYLSTDHDPENKQLLCFVPEAMNYDQWRKHPEYQVSRPVTLTQGQRYYLEIRHKEHTWRDHMSLAWLTPNSETFEIIDGAFLSPVNNGDVDRPTIQLAGPTQLTLTVGSEYQDPGYSASDSSQGDLTDQVRVEGQIDTSRAGLQLLRYYVTDPSGNEALVASREVNVIVADSLDATYSPDQSANHPLTTYNEPDSISTLQAARFLKQATFGPDSASIARVQEIGYEAWIDEQLALPFSSHLEAADRYSAYSSARNNLLNTIAEPSLEGDLPGMMMEMEEADVETRDRLWTWWTLAATAPDQLRQRVAFALSEIVVISDYPPALRNYPRGVANYYDILGNNAFGNYRDILEETTLNPMMGIWLTLVRSNKEQADENLAREILQLFSLGLNRLNLDGTLQLDSNGNSIPSYTEEDVQELSRAFTGWTFANSHSFYQTGAGGINETQPLMAFEEFHDTGEKVLLGGATIPAGQTAAQDISRSMDIIFQHPNIAPFISHLLIQRLVTSNPSPAYIYRVASKFEDNGQGTRGDLAAVVKAILLDPEARNTPDLITGGKLSEPLMRPLRLMRAFPNPPTSNPPVLGRYMLQSIRENLAQSPVQANSVFNFFSPDYQKPGPLMDAGLVSPEFEIATEITTVNTSNFLVDGVTRGFPVNWHAGGRLTIDKSLLINQWQNPQQLLTTIEELLLARPMSDTMRNALLSVHTAYQTRPTDGVSTILGITSSSPAFAVEY